MEKIKLSTPDITQENIERIAELFPDVVTESFDDDGSLVRAIDFDALRQNLSGAIIDGPRERYQFTWPGKQAAKLEARKSCDKTMRPIREDSVNWDTTENLYIEGDNLEALKIMRETYAGKVKLIYIDPPYNTGHDFIYDDDFAQTRAAYEAESGEFDETGGRLVVNPESNGRFHSDWCSMMYPRLLLARDLLTSDGSIFVSIDSHEQPNARKLLDEIFGTDNFVADIACVNKPSGRSDDKYIATAHESILVYRKTDALLLGGFEPEEHIISRYTKRDSDGRLYRDEDLRKRGTNDERVNRPNLFYPFFYDPKTESLSIGSNDDETPEGCIRIVPMKTSEIEGSWRWGKETASSDLAHLHALYMENKGQWSIFEMQYLDERGDVKPTSVWSQKDVNSERGTEAFVQLGFNQRVFQNPKPVGTLSRIIRIASSTDSIVMDFFSGSASTAHALFVKNLEDGGRRKFILVQIPEECDEDSAAFSSGFANICEIGKERIRRAGAKIAEEAEAANKQLKLGEEPKQIPDVGFRVLRIGSSNFRDTYTEPGTMNQSTIFDYVDNLIEGRSAEDLLFQIMPKFRIPYSAKYTTSSIAGKTIFNVNDGQLIACFDEDVDETVIEEIAKRKPLYAVFRDASMANDATAANFEELFKTYSPDTIRRVI